VIWAFFSILLAVLRPSEFYNPVSTVSNCDVPGEQDHAEILGGIHTISSKIVKDLA
jgi:hypothetical protein